MNWKNLFSGILPDKFSSIVLERGACEDMTEFARTNHPKEFIALLDGKVKDNALHITGLLFQPFDASRHSTVMKAFLPPATAGVGSVHSHPSSSIRPSDADRRFFSKHGMVHFIIAYPYDKEHLACFDIDGNRLEFKLKS